MWLFNCLDEELRNAVLQANTNPAPKDMSEQALLLSIKALAVQKSDSVSTPSSAHTATPW